MIGRAMKTNLLRKFLLAWAVPLGLGGLSVFGFAPFYLFPIPILVLALFYFSLSGASPAGAFRRGWLFGLGWFLAGVSWVYVSMHDVGGMDLPLAAAATFLFAAVLALFPALACWLTVRRRAIDDLRALLWFPAFWALAEWLRGWLFTGFPWQSLGYSQVPYGPLSGYAPILGVYGVSWLAALSAAGIARWKARTLLVVAALWVVGLGLQKVAWTEPAGAPLGVSLLQGDIPQEMKFRPEQLAATLERYGRMVMASDSKLIVLPETAFPTFMDYLPPDYLDQLRAHAARAGGDLLFGVPELLGSDHYYNSVVAAGSSPLQVYRKVHLVPFGEFVPYGFHWLVDAMNVPLSDFSRGRPDQPPLSIAGQRVAVNVCYEDVFGEELIDALPTATLMVNVSNDAWFGDSFAPWQHLQIAQMRALETGRWWLKDNNTGVTAILDQKGRVVSRLKPFRPGILNGAVQPMTGETPFVRWGNLAFLALAALSLLAVLGLDRRAGVKFRPID